MEKRFILEIDFTRRTQILLLATVLLITSWFINFIFYPEGIGIIFTLLIIPFSTFATYAAATDMDWSLFDRWGSTTVTVRTRSIGKTSAVSVWSLVAVGFVGLEIFAWFLIGTVENLWDFIAISLCILGGIVIIGGYIAHKEWEI
ncbi:MAG: hypothetical protein JSW11_20345 [Candidatus Heimdallarchaeota archaeon]|nr:MAG: hypothetical protein JSW11_20345 [Candidatus Heimdallarchaeota archaeon]